MRTKFIAFVQIASALKNQICQIQVRNGDARLSVSNSARALGLVYLPTPASVHTTAHSSSVVRGGCTRSPRLSVQGDIQVDIGVEHGARTLKVVLLHVDGRLATRTSDVHAMFPVCASIPLVKL